MLHERVCSCAVDRLLAFTFSTQNDERMKKKQSHLQVDLPAKCSPLLHHHCQHHPDSWNRSLRCSFDHPVLILIIHDQLGMADAGSVVSSVRHVMGDWDLSGMMSQLQTPLPRQSATGHVLKCLVLVMRLCM